MFGGALCQGTAKVSTLGQDQNLYITEKKLEAWFDQKVSLGILAENN